MFWVKEYCKYFDLTLEGTNVILDSNIVAKIDYYENIIYFLNTETKCKLSDVMHAIILNTKLH